MTTEETFRAMQRLPQFPSLATKLLRLLSHDDADIKSIVNLIRSDSSMTSELLRVVNSPVYSFSGRISSIQNAVTLMGFDTVKSFALTVSMRSYLQGAMRLDLLRKIWRHSLACAILCEDLSAACSPVRRPDDRAYTAGLLHDIGRLCLFVEHPAEYADLLLADTGEANDILKHEHQLFGADHCEVGSWLASNWGFPEELQNVAAKHHDPVNTADFGLVDMVRVAVLLADKLGFGVGSSTTPQSIPEILSMLPVSAQYRCDPDPQLMKARITDRLDSFD
jgi:putative nucleotidyltransferase with HDIG domain